MKEVTRHLEAALKILKPQMDELKTRYGDDWARHKDCILYHNMCADIISALKLAQYRPDLFKDEMQTKK